MRAAWLLAGIIAFLSACAPVIAPPGPGGTAAIDGETLTTSDGLSLPLRTWAPEGKPKAVVAALHGFNDYGNFINNAAAFWAERGIAVYAYDQRGFGAAPHRGLWAGREAMTGDIKTFARLLRARHPKTPLHLLGVSMGGAVVMTAMTDEDPPDVDGVILSGPAVWGRRTMPWYQPVALWIGAHAIPGVVLTGRGIKRRPSDNVEMLRALGRDPLMIRGARVDALWGVTDLMDEALEATAKLRGPTLILIGANDDIVPHPAYRAMRELLPDDPGIRLVRYEYGYHMLLRDLQAETVWKDAAAWMRDQRAPLPSGAEEAARKP